MKIANTAGLAVCLALGGCGTFYVDDTLKEVTGADKVAVAQPQPVQMLFEFQTKGVRNGSATDYVKKDLKEKRQVTKQTLYDGSKKLKHKIPKGKRV